MKYLIFNMVGWVVVLLVIFVFKPWDKKKMMKAQFHRQGCDKWITQEKH